MKIQCNVCEAAESKVLCCADEAALCTACDEKVHAANKLASKHQRVPLSNSASLMPKCDICPETVGYFFCLEDRALLCRNCDVAIHTANPHVSSHRRFLLTGVKVGPESSEAGSRSSIGKSPLSASGEKHNRMEPVQLGAGNLTPSKRRAPGDNKWDYSPSRMCYAGGSTSRSTTTGSTPQWQWHIEDEFLGPNEFGLNSIIGGYPGCGGTSKADSGRFVEEYSDSSSVLRSPWEEEVDAKDECLRRGLGVQVPDIRMTRGGYDHEIPSPAPTASGLYWPRHSSLNWASNGSFSVPDITCFPSAPNSSHPKRS